MLFLASLTFYGFWRVEFMPVMLVSAVTDYVVSLCLARSRSRSRRRALLCVSLAINLGLLFTFKYLIFFVDNAWGLAGMLGLLPFSAMDLHVGDADIHLPVYIPAIDWASSPSFWALRSSST